VPDSLIDQLVHPLFPAVPAPVERSEAAVHQEQEIDESPPSVMTQPEGASTQIPVAR
jgi:hypothetical protein